MIFKQNCETREFDNALKPNKCLQRSDPTSVKGIKGEHKCIHIQI